MLNEQVILTPYFQTNFLHGKVAVDENWYVVWLYCQWSGFIAARAIISFHEAIGTILALWCIPIYNKYITFCVHHSSTYQSQCLILSLNFEVF